MSAERRVEWLEAILREVLLEVNHTGELSGETFRHANKVLNRRLDATQPARGEELEITAEDCVVFAVWRPVNGGTRIELSLPGLPEIDRSRLYCVVPSEAIARLRAAPSPERDAVEAALEELGEEAKKYDRSDPAISGNYIFADGLMYAVNKVREALKGGG